MRKGFMIKKLAAPALLLCLAALCACSGAVAQTQESNSTASTSMSVTTTSKTTTGETETTDSAGSNIAAIKLHGDFITLEGRGAEVNGSTITILNAGTYTISGALEDGRILVYTGDEETVRLVLNGADIACSDSAPIYIVNAGKTIIELAAGSRNYLTDGNSYTLAGTLSDEPSAAIFSNDDLTINGTGSLTINASYKNGIQGDDDIKINGGIITIIAVNDGIKANDSVVVKDGNITLETGGDGIQATNDADSEKGYVSIGGGTVNVVAAGDGIQAETKVIISGGSVNIVSGGGSSNAGSNVAGGIVMPGNPGGLWGNMPDTDGTTGAATASAKGIKAGIDLTIEGGTINIDSSDDCLHSNSTLVISGGDMVLSSGDDGIHSDTSIEIDGGNISIAKCYEGIESALITLNDGNIHLISSDDGINTVDTSQTSGGFPGQGVFGGSGSNNLYINGGYVYMDAGGDGLDINGPIMMAGGTVIINGPTSNANGAIDYLGEFKITGGLLVAAGSSGMAQAPSASSSQYSVMVNTNSQQAGTLFHIETEEGEDILTFSPSKTYQSIVFCSPEIEKGVTYIVFLGGESTGTAVDCLYSGGTYSPGTRLTTFTVSSMVTNIGSSAGGFNPGGRR